MSSTRTVKPTPAPRLLAHGLGLTPAVVWVALYVALVLNSTTFWRRAQTYPEGVSALQQAAVVAGEMLLVLVLTALLCTAATLAGRSVWRLFASVLILASAACAYYMTRFDITIGYGVLSAVFTTDHDMSAEVIGLGALFWTLLLGVLPLPWLWRAAAPPALWRQWCSPLRLMARLALLLCLALAMAGAQKLLRHTASQVHIDTLAAMPNAAGVAAHSYLPSNWLAGSGMVLSSAVAGQRQRDRLQDPARLFRFEPQADLSDVVLVFVIGETARHDRFGLLGHSRDTTPRLAQTPGVAAFAAESCDTTTKLSLACMFVRPEGIRQDPGMGPDVILEDMVFSVLRQLGFGIELFALQSEVGFYNRVQTDHYKFREVILAQPQNAGLPVHDMPLLPELATRLKRASQPGQAPRPLAVLLHTKGSHFLYTQRYPREFARWQPECMGVDADCDTAQLMNSFDNSILYTDHMLAEAIELLRTHKALLVYTSDHGESISDGMHLHGTPRSMAPPEQRAVPLVFWASDRFRADPGLHERFERLQQRARDSRIQAGHHHLFASLLGCLGVTSPDGGITPDNNLCH